MLVGIASRTIHNVVGLHLRANTTVADCIERLAGIEGVDRLLIIVSKR